MVKWKKLNKKMAGFMLGIMMLFTASTTAFAYVDESAEASKTEATQTEQAVSQEDAQTEEVAGTDEVLPENTDSTSTGTAFSTPGNGEVKDDITDSSSKEFLTVTTKNNNTFYIVIDRSATSQNVYMLSQVDENDLAEFLDKDSTATVVTPQTDTSNVVLDETESNDDTDKETSVDTQKKDQTNTNMGAMAAILILALGGVAAYYYFKIYKPKKEAEEDDQPEGLETEGLEEVPDEEESEDEDFEENEK